MRKRVVGIMGPGVQASVAESDAAFELGRAIAGAGHILLTGGRNTGVMDAALRGAKSVGGLTVGVLPTVDESTYSEAADIRIITDMGSARNYINILSSDVVVACGMNHGTGSEICLALARTKPVVLLRCSESAVRFFREIGGELVHSAESVAHAFALIAEALETPGTVSR